MSHIEYERTMAYLREEGYRPEAVEDYRILFRAESTTFLVDFDWDDPLFVRLVVPNFWSIDDEFERDRVVKAADEANKKIKCAKVWTLDENVCASIELFLPDTKKFPEVLDRALSAIRASVQEFCSNARVPERAPVTLTAVHDSAPN